jgi:hypothetical protein
MEDKQRRRAILAEIAALGPVLPGCIIERSTRCQSPGCRCRSEPPVLHGPYATWTHREGGRQVTRTIAAEQAEHLRPLIENGRRLRQLVAELEQLAVKTVVNELSSLGPQPKSPRRPPVDGVGKRRPQAGK